MVRGELKVDLCCLATKLLLTRIVAQVTLDPTLVEAGIDELRTLFIKNESMPKVQVDLARIFK
jgi:hypothetical protein